MTGKASGGRSAWGSAFLFALFCLSFADAKPLPPAPVVIPDVASEEQRLITVRDLAVIRDIDSLSLSPDGTHFAILVRQADPDEDRYDTAWYIGKSSGGSLTYVGDGGPGRLMKHVAGHVSGDVAGSVARWSPDGKWIAYTIQRDGETQLWKSRAEGGAQVQVTHNAADIREFAWGAGGEALYFAVGSTRAALKARDVSLERRGYPLEEFNYLFRAVNPGKPDRALETELTIWRVSAGGRGERVANDAEKEDYRRALNRNFSSTPGGVEVDPDKLSGAVAPAVPRPSGDGAAWMVQTKPEQKGALPEVRMMASLSQDLAAPIACPFDACVGQFFRKTWWSADGKEVVFWRADTDFLTTEQEIHAWDPATGALRTILDGSDAKLEDCDLYGREIICLRETGLKPQHVAALNVDTGDIRIIADVNPEFAKLRFGAIERIEWDLPQNIAGAEYGDRAMGYILYPPDYDPARKYPAFIAPYLTGGFNRGDLGDEHPLLVYAANDIIVINTAFPSPLKIFAESTQDERETNLRTYDPDKDFPHMSLYAASTISALDKAAETANIDMNRVGIGGVSHGAFIPLYIMQKYDRLSALSLAGGGWSQLEYYLGKFPAVTEETPETGVWPEDPEFWRQIDLADHLETVEAPVLFNFPDRELISGVRLARRLRNAKLPVDAYSFVNEYHSKFHPSHRLTIYERNLDWFRFWLRDTEDSTEEKRMQYEKWRLLRAQQCLNPLSLRDYCEVESIMAVPAH